ncbi:hypothetical protein [Sporomusa aerivorans]|uniref:hypothetical protein n=1 Tax=Sporomusa aerivorans TaxID=204936 RepID=UPI00352AF5FD
MNLILAGSTVVQIAAYKWMIHLALAALAEALAEALAALAGSAALGDLVALGVLAALADADFSRSDFSRTLMKMMKMKKMNFSPIGITESVMPIYIGNIKQLEAS